MIVSVTIADNRESEIADALRSVIDHVDRVVVVDTGITDRTLEIAREIVGEKKLISFAFEWTGDFSAARNAGLEAAEAFGADWIVIVDTDERVDFGEIDLTAALKTTPAAALLVDYDEGLYAKPRVIRAGIQARFFGPVHEALITGRLEPLRGATFRELPKTAGQLEMKYERDVEALLDFIQSYPDDPRWWYYLGASYEGLEDRENAVQAYGECVSLRKTGEEAAWAAYRQAALLILLERFDEAVKAAARGLGADAGSAECAWAAASASQRAGRPEQAIAWARISEALGRYNGCGTERLHFRYPPASYELPYDILRSVLRSSSGRAQANRDFHDAKAARIHAIARSEDDLDALSVDLSLSESIRWEARQALRPPTIRSLCDGVTASKIQFAPPGGMIPTNPTICRHDGEFVCVVRAVNYSMNGRHYVVHDPNNVVRTENYLGRLSLDGKFVDVVPMRDLDKSERFPSRVLGYEDIRLVSIKGRAGETLVGSATVCDRDSEGRRLIAKLTLSARGDIKKAEVQESNQICEKNWMPISVDGKFAYIYSLDPTAIVPGPLRSCPFALDHLRGGAATAYKGGYLCVAHETQETDAGRVYLHRFVRLSDSFRVTSVSQAWVFGHYGIEFCAGLVCHRGQVLLSYGIEDREAWIMRVDAKEIEAMNWITP